MNYKINTTNNFKREVRALAKKYPSLKSDIEKLADALVENPRMGKSLGNDIYKIRMSIKSKGKGKRSGARVMTQIKVVKKIVYLFSIYDKSDKNSISDNEIKQLIKDIPL